jgi:hypothetical protein
MAENMRENSLGADEAIGGGGADIDRASKIFVAPLEGYAGAANGGVNDGGVTPGRSAGPNMRVNSPAPPDMGDDTGGCGSGGREASLVAGAMG